MLATATVAVAMVVAITTAGARAKRLAHSERVYYVVATLATALGVVVVASWWMCSSGNRKGVGGWLTALSVWSGMGAVSLGVWQSLLASVWPDTISIMGQALPFTLVFYATLFLHVSVCGALVYLAGPLKSDRSKDVFGGVLWGICMFAVVILSTVFVGISYRPVVAIAAALAFAVVSLLAPLVCRW